MNPSILVEAIDDVTSSKSRNVAADKRALVPSREKQKLTATRSDGAKKVVTTDDCSTKCTSCPEILKKRASDNCLLLHSSSSRSSPPSWAAESGKMLLAVPCSFVTSLTTSANALSPDEKQSNHYKGYRHSAPELLGRSLDDVTKPELHDDVLELFQRNHKIWRVTEFLFIGDAQAAKNNHLMCRLGIESVVDLTDGCNPDEPDNLSKAPCTCSVQHRRNRLSISPAHCTLVEFRDFFPQINKFIEGCRSSEKKILIYCANGQLMSVPVCLQYLISVTGYTLAEAYAQVSNNGCNASINDSFLTLLSSIEVSSSRNNSGQQCEEASDEFPERGSTLEMKSSSKRSGRPIDTVNSSDFSYDNLSIDLQEDDDDEITFRSVHVAVETDDSDVSSVNFNDLTLGYSYKRDKLVKTSPTLNPKRREAWTDTS